jgi:hypothetical protein
MERELAAYFNGLELRSAKSVAGCVLFRESVTLLYLHQLELKKGQSSREAFDA